MLPVKTQGKIQKTTQRVEFSLVLFLAYVASLAYVWIRTGNFVAIVIVHLTFVLIFSLIYFGYGILMFLVSPIFAIAWPIEHWRVKRYLRQFKQNVPAETAVILGHADWFKLQGWVKPIFLKREIKALAEYLQVKRQDFSFYPDASFADVERIMGDKNVKEVYFFGHGDSHVFQLGTEEILYYCDFNNAKYEKEFAHQVHCGDPYGKSLLDYVVPEENRPKCFFFRKAINSRDIMKEFRKRTDALTI